MTRKFNEATQQFEPVRLSVQKTHAAFAESRERSHNKVFISHKSEDIQQAESVAKCLANYEGIESYIDVFDSTICGDSGELIDYIIEQIESMSGLIAVVSEYTRESWWVPGEFFVAHQNGLLIGTYLLEGTSRESLPSFMRDRWPIIENHDELRKWAKNFRAMGPALSSVANLAKRVESAASFYNRPDIRDMTYRGRRV